MLGTVYIALNDMVVDRHGVVAWDKILDEVKPDSEGVFTSIETYQDTELTQFIAAIAALEGISPTDVEREFGQYLFAVLNRKSPIFTQLAPNLFSYLRSVETVIHPDVKKRFTDSSLPTITCSRGDARELLFEYRSARKLCYLSEGLILAAAQHYGEAVSLEHSTCMHRGADHCSIRVQRHGE